MSGYEKIFDPPLVPKPVPAEHLADRAAASAYVYDENLVLAVNVALATRRPLLLRGRPGTGKSSLARNVAMLLGRRFYPRTISSRTQARDLLWTVDDVARLSDATSPDGAGDRASYVRPGVLWWAFSPETAAWRGIGIGSASDDLLPGPGPDDVPGQVSGPGLGAAPGRLPDPNEGVAEAAEAVVLLDEIDKADPDVPNDLLEPLGLYRFRTENGDLVEAGHAPLVVLTTNEERDLPKAFLRRCVVHVLPLPTRRRLREIALVQLGPPVDSLYDDIVRALAPAGPAAGAAAGPAGVGGVDGVADDEHVDVSIAEFLDAVAAARRLGVRPGHPRWPDLLAATTSKPATVDLR